MTLSLQNKEIFLKEYMSMIVRPSINKVLIQFTVLYEGEEFEIKTFNNEYRNLMVLLFDKIYIEEFGDCGGMGRCGTCMVKIEGLNSERPDERNEKRTLSKMGIDANESGIRLSCQILVDENLNNRIIEIVK